MNKAAPIVNFNGAFLVGSLEVGSLLISTKRVSAVKIMLHQTLNYSVLAHGRIAAEIYVYCFDAHQNGRRKLEVYAPSIMIEDRQSGRLLPVIANITWYVPPALREQCSDRITAVLGGDVLGDETYPVFQGKPFALFDTEWCFLEGENEQG
jgi:hypothetical protein